MARYVFLSHRGDDRNQVKGFILLRWNKNIKFSFFDRSLVDPVKSRDAAYIRWCIRKKMHGTSVTAVLIGEKTHNSKWVEWEIEESVNRGNGLVGIKLKGKSNARTPSLLRAYGVDILTWRPSIFKDAIERTARWAGR